MNDPEALEQAPERSPIQAEGAVPGSGGLAEGEPEPASERFLEEVEARLVAPYLLERGRRLICRETSTGQLRDVCAPVLVTDLLLSPAGTRSSLRLRFLTLEGRVAALEIPNDDLAGASPKGVEMLRRAGLHMPANARDMAALLRSFRPQRQAETGVAPGWHPSGALLFRLRDGRVVVPDAPLESQHQRLFQPDAKRLEQWKREVAAHATGNPYALFGLAHALSGPLLTHSGGRSFGINLAVPTSRGKTTLAAMLAAVWPGCPVESWDNSAAGFEDFCVAADGTLLVLDEFPQEKVREAVQSIYRIMNGRARGVRRGLRGTSAVETRPGDWAMAVVSTSEAPIPTLARGSGVTLRGGVGVRMLDLSPDVLWEDHTGFASAFDLLKALEVAVAETEGIAGPMFVHGILRHWDKLSGRLPQLREATRNDLRRQLGTAGAGKDEGVFMRILDAGTTIALAGQLASRLNVLPQTTQQIRSAVALVLRAALDPQPLPDAHAAALERLRAWLGRYATSRLAEIDEAGRPVGRPRAAAGWRSDSCYFLLPDTLRLAIGPGPALTKFLQYLDDLGLLRRGRDRNSFQRRMGARIHGRPYVYCILREGLDLGPEDMGD